MDAAAVVAELVDEVRVQEGEAKRHAAGVALLGEAFAQSSALSFATIRALRTYTAELEGAVQSLAPGHLAVGGGGVPQPCNGRKSQSSAEPVYHPPHTDTIPCHSAVFMQPYLTTSC
jgi:hypothetical protein